MHAKWKLAQVYAVMLGCLGWTTVGAITMRDDILPEWHTLFGDLPVFDNVGRLDFSTPAGDFRCSGTLIDPSWALTAAHCVDEAVSIDVNIGGVDYAADDWFHHPDWVTGSIFNLFAGNDIGLVHLAEPVDAVAPAELYTGSSEAGHLAWIAGYGQTGDGFTGGTSIDDELRAGLNMIDAYAFGDVDTAGAFLYDFDNPDGAWELLQTGSPYALPFEVLAAPGDSGGPVFIIDAGELLLAGVTSFVLNLDFGAISNYGDMSGATRVGRYESWIDNVMAGGAAASLSGTSPAALGQPPGSAVLRTAVLPLAGLPVPEPASLLLLAGGLGLALWPRGRARDHLAAGVISTRKP